MLRICHVIFAGLVLLMVGCAAQGVADKAATKPQADRILIEKSAHTMKLMSGGQVLKTYKVALGNPKGTKQREGDRETPEGEYVIDSRNEHSRFHRALHISYPDAADRERAKKLGVNPGGDVEIHGLPSTFAWAGSLHRFKDWTGRVARVSD